MTQRTLPELHALLRQSWSWYREGLAYSVSYVPAPAHLDYAVLSDAELQLIDSRLPTVLQEHFRIANENPHTKDPLSPAIPASLILCQLRHWQHAMYCCTRSKERLYLERISAVDYFDDIDYVAVTASSYRVQVVPHLKTALPVECVIEQLDGHTLELDNTWLDNTYPGWRDRLQHARTLGYLGKDLYMWLCETPGNNAPLALPPETFS